MLNTLIQFFYEMNGLNKGIEIFTMEERIMLRRFLITMTTFLVVVEKAYLLVNKESRETFVRFMSLPMEPP